MATKGNKRYLQYILLLGEGSTIVLKGLLNREVRRKETTLETLLTNNKNSLERQLHNTKQFEHIFRLTGAVNTDLDTWDIALLAKVILLLNHSTLTLNEKAAVRLIKDLRNELQAHASMMSFEEDEFYIHWEDLSATLKQLMTSLETVIQEKCEGIIKKLEKGINNVNDVSEDIRGCGKCDKLLIDVVNSTVDLVKSKLKETEDRMSENNQKLTQEIQSTSKVTQELIDKRTSDIEHNIERNFEESDRVIHEVVEGVSETLENIEASVSKANVQIENVSNETREAHSLTEDIHQKVDAMSEQVSDNTKLIEKIPGMEETLKNLCEQMSRLQREGKDFKTPQNLDIEIEITGPTKEVTQKADEQLIKAFEIAMTKAKRARLAGDTKLNTELDKLVQKFKDDIESLEGVEVQDVRKECVLLSLKCTSLESMTCCITYLHTTDSVKYFRRMSHILTNHFGQPIGLSTKVHVGSVQRAMEILEYIQPVKHIFKIPVRFHTLSGLKEVSRKFVEEEEQETLTGISSYLTDHYGRKITVNGRLNIPQIHNALNAASGSKDTDFPKSLEPRAEAAAGYASFDKAASTIRNIRTVNIRLKEDRFVCSIYRINQTVDGSILLADHNNMRLKRLNASYEITDFCNFPAKPWGVCEISNDEVIVALNNNSLQFVKIGGEMIVSKSVRFTHPCWSLSYHSGRIFIKGGDCVYSYDTSGGDKRKLYTEPTDGTVYQNIRISNSGERMYITNDRKGFIAIDMNGKIVGKYEDTDIEATDDICSDDEGNLYICDRTSMVVSQINEHTLVKVRNITEKSDGVYDPWVLCYNQQQHSLIIGHCRKDTITVVDLLKQ